MRRNQKRGIPPVAAAILVILLVVGGTWLAFRKELPFRSHFEIHAVVRDANQLRKGSVVRIAGVEVGKVTKVEPVGNDEQASRITMRLTDQGRPIHKDATLKVRPRILLEGNFFVDLQPGSPEAPDMGSGETIPINQTAGPVQLDQVLDTFQTDTRHDLASVLHELHTGLNGGAQALNRTMPYWAPAYRGSAIVNDATLGENPHDLSGYLKGASRVAEGLDRNSAELQSLIGDLRTTAAAFAAHDTSLEDALAELPRTLRTGRPALGALNAALPSVRRFAAALRPGVRNAGPSLDAQIPFVHELRGLVQPSELRGLTADLRPTVPALAQLNKATVPLLEQARAASSCQNQVILPWTTDTVPDRDFPSTGPVYQEQAKPLVGLAGESRTFDANGQWFRVALNAAQFATPFGDNKFLLTNRPILGANPPPGPRPPLRSDVPCETQQPPDLRTQQLELQQKSFKVAAPPPTAALKAQTTAVKWLREEAKSEGNPLKVVDNALTASDLPKIPKVQLPAAKGKGR